MLWSTCYAIYTLSCFYKQTHWRNIALQQHTSAKKTEQPGQGNGNYMSTWFCLQDSDQQNSEVALRHHQTKTSVSSTGKWKPWTTMLSRPIFTSPWEHRFNKRQATQDIISTTNDIRYHLRAATNTVMSDATVQNQLYGFSINAGRPVRRPTLTANYWAVLRAGALIMWGGNGSGGLNLVYIRVPFLLAARWWTHQSLGTSLRALLVMQGQLISEVCIHKHLVLFLSKDCTSNDHI